MSQIRYEQKLNANVSLDLAFRDEDGKPIRLGQYFGKKPVVLVMAYYECPMLCTMVFNGMVESAQDMKWSIGREFDVVCVSINPADTSTLAMAKKRTYLKRYGRAGAEAGWHFLTGNETAIRRLSDEVGFHYAYDPVAKEFAHPSGLVILTPEGKVSRYLFGVTYPPKELYSALRDASTSKVGSPIQQLILLCFHYNPVTGKYSANIIIILRILGAATILGVLGMIAALMFRKRGTLNPIAITSSGAEQRATKVHLYNVIKTSEDGPPSLPRSGGEGGGTCRAATPASQREPFHQAGEVNTPLSGSLPARDERGENSPKQIRALNP